MNLCVAKPGVPDTLYGTDIIYVFAKSVVVFTKSHRAEEAGLYFCEPGLKAHKFHYFHLTCSVTNSVRSLYPP